MQARPISYFLYPIQNEVQENVFILLAREPNEYEDPIHSLTYLNVFCGDLGKCSLDFNSLGQVVAIIIIAPCPFRPSRGGYERAVKGQEPCQSNMLTCLYLDMVR